MVQNQDSKKNNKNKIGSFSSFKKISKVTNVLKPAPAFDFDVVNFTNNQCMFGISRQRKAPVQSYEQVLVLQPQALVNSNLVEIPRRKKQRKQESSSKIIETHMHVHHVDSHPLQTRTDTTTCTASSCCSTSNSTSSNASVQLPSTPHDFLISYNNQQLTDNTKTSRTHRSSISIRELLN